MRITASSWLITDNGDGTYTYATPKTTCEAYAVIQSYQGAGSYGSMFTLKLNGAEQLKDLTFQIVIKSECGVEYLSDPVAHPDTGNS